MTFVQKLSLGLVGAVAVMAAIGALMVQQRKDELVPSPSASEPLPRAKVVETNPPKVDPQPHIVANIPPPKPPAPVPPVPSTDADKIKKERQELSDEVWAIEDKRKEETRIRKEETRIATLVNLARNWEKNDRPDLALKNYRELVSRYPNSAQAKTAKERIKALSKSNP
jgi:hypothetical protein